MYLCRRLKHIVLQHIHVHPIHKASVFVIKNSVFVVDFLVFVFLYLRHMVLRHAAVCPSTMQVSLLSPFCVNCHMLNLSPPGQDPPPSPQKIRTRQVQSERQEYKNTAKNIYTRKNINVRLKKYKYSNPIKSRTLNIYSSSGENSLISLPSS